MKNIFKKLIVTISVISVTLTVVGVSVFATQDARPMPNSGASVTDTVKSNNNDSSAPSSSVSATGGAQAPTQIQTEATPSKTYLTKWGGFFWFILSIIVNFILSCWISNRFYRLAKRNTQGSAEIRALRKDIEEKFASTLTDINEPATEIVNRNENYARTDDGIEMPDRKPTVEIDEAGREMLGKWDMQRTAQRSEENEFGLRHPEDRIRFEEEPDKEPAPSKMETITKAGTKAKDFLSNIFPFEE